MLELGFNLNQVCVRMESRCFLTSVPLLGSSSQAFLIYRCIVSLSETHLNMMCCLLMHFLVFRE